MKPLLAIDITTDKKNEKFNGDEFIVQRTSPELLDSHNTAIENVEKTEKRSELPVVVNIIKNLSFFVSLVIIAGYFKAASDDLSLADAYNNAPYLAWISGTCLIIYIVMKIIEKKNSKTVLESDEAAHEIDKLNNYTDAIYSELSVPDNSRNLDILFFHYKLKNGEIKPCEIGAMPTPYINFATKAFTDETNLYLATLDCKYGIPLSSITKIRTVKKRISIFGWNKDIGIKEGIYKQYKLSSSDLGLINCKRYHIIEINHIGELYCIYIPDYELVQIEELTGLKAIEE